jgi:hypothetical protein
VVELLEEFRESFAWSIHDLSDTSIEGVEFEVNFTDDKVIWSPHRRQSLAEYELLKAYCEERCAAKLICRLKLPEGIKHPNATPCSCDAQEERRGRELDRDTDLWGLPAA